MTYSRLLSWFCALSKLLCDFNAASTSANWFTSASSSQATLFDCIILDINDQLLDTFGPEMKDHIGSNTVRVTASTSLSLLILAIVSWSLLREEKLDLFSISFKFPIALWSGSFTIFLEVKYFLTSLASTSDSPPPLLRTID
ncbi:hypothetical protein RchiOBHm_Chr6g0279911 [Rosa chinensis]|uniref:Uncharacterized protein n=1 Tax=Rosa chinensis TaxID=74649 RepID=A0A2P6PT54_ROSCH|nr:hypothetical protein RchiOBHm_Chr6g0279911 [Rosa chinensis]